jgi:hypothetical protein
VALPVVRPPTWPAAPAPAPSAPAGRTDARMAAQKAFFEAALAGKVAGAGAAEPSRAARAAEAVRAVAATETQTAAERLPRPGSIIDIWV